MAYCEQEQITFTRGRPSQKRDQCNALAEKWSDSSRLWSGMIASWENMQARQLIELYRALRLYVNCFQPLMKLLSKQREGKKVRCVNDPAKTPLQRVLLSGILPAQKLQELSEVAKALDTIGLFHQLEQLQQAVFRCAVSLSPFVSNTPSVPICVFSMERCTAGKLPAEGS